MIQTVAVIGAGTMGSGIAQVVAMAGCDTTLFDPSRESIRNALERIESNLRGAVERGKIEPPVVQETIRRIQTRDDLKSAVRQVDLVIEAVPESIDLKSEVFRTLGEAAPAEAILASNTSAIRIIDIARSTTRSDRVVGLHFFNPVHLMKLVEVVRSPETSDETLAACVDFSRRISKEPIVVTDTPGFASSRLGVVLGLEAMRMVEEGVASPQDIDRAMMLGYNHPMGPLRLSDVVGLDVRLGIAEYLHEAYQDDRYLPPMILRQKVAEGSLGKKTGQGFYTWA